MTRPTNRQSRSVGNSGDILKHAALTELVSGLAAMEAKVRFVDTHAFLLHAPIADLSRWERETDALAIVHPAYQRYVALERAFMARTGHYRCSSGLVLDLLGERRDGAVLGEANPVTRAELREQLGREQHPNVELHSDAVHALQSTGAEINSLLVHVDPFVLSPEVWSGLASALDELCERSSQVVLLAYRYTREAPSAWPAAPRGTLGPVAQIRGGPHELSAYASPNTEALVRAVCLALGWKPSAGEPRA